MNLTQHSIIKQSGDWTLNFPHVVAWYLADPGTKAEDYRGHSVSDLAESLGYCSALAALVAAELCTVLEPDSCDAVSLVLDEDPRVTVDGSPRIRVGGELTDTRAGLADVVRRMVTFLDGRPDADGGRDAADVLVERQRDALRTQDVFARLDALAHGDRLLWGQLRARIPDPYRQAEAAEVAVADLEREIHAALIQRAADAQTNERNES